MKQFLYNTLCGLTLMWACASAIAGVFAVIWLCMNVPWVGLPIVILLIAAFIGNA